MSELQAVLFDMDGTLVETEHYWDSALEELAVRLGGRLSSTARAGMTGASVPVSLQLLYDDIGVPRTREESAGDDAWLQARVVALLTAGVTWQPGAKALLAAVRAAGIPTALVTTTHRPLTAIVLGHLAADLTGWDPAEETPGEHPFTVTVCGDEVPAVKPDPAPYLQAMTALGVEPAGCVVVEDSVAGVTAGLAAGAVVLGMPSLQGVPGRPGLTVLPTLVGVGVDELHELVAARGGSA